MFFKGCMSAECIGSIAFNNYHIQTVMMKLHKLGMAVDEVTGALESSGTLTSDQASKGKMNVLVQEIEYQCQGCKECMSEISKAIEEDRLPLSATNAEWSWDSNNFYRDIDKVNWLVPPPKEPEE